MRLGFNTGCFLEHSHSLSDKAVNLALKLGCEAIELDSGFIVKIPHLPFLSTSLLKNFDYVSVHAPANVGYENNSNTRDLLNKLADFHSATQFDTLVLHPHTVKDWSVFKDYSLPLAFENMDSRKPFGKTVEEMKSIFNHLPQAKMVLDIQHAFSMDKSGSLVDDFMKEFSDRISHFHVSGYIDDDSFHHFVFHARNLEMLEKLQSKFPIILEGNSAHLLSGSLESLLREELNFVRSAFRSVK